MLRAQGWAPPIEHFVTDKRHGGAGNLGQRLIDGGEVSARLGVWLARRRPRVVHIHCGSGWSLREAAAHAALAVGVRARVIVHLHAASLHDHWDATPWERPAIAGLLARVDGVAVLSPGTAIALQGLGLRARWAVVPNGVPLPPPRDPQRSPGPWRLVLVGAPSARKGLADLLDAWELIGDLRARFEVRWLGGTDACPPADRARADALGVTLVGAVAPEHVAAEVEAADGFVLASRREGAPFALLEAMAAGLPILATDTGAVREILGTQSGTVVPPLDPPALAAALTRWADGGPPVHQGVAARERVRAAFTMEHTAQAVRSLWEQRIGSAR